MTSSFTPYPLFQALADHPEGIHVFAVALHTHLVGMSVRVRHFRNGVELPVINEDLGYDFNYQEARMLPEEVTILPVCSVDWSSVINVTI